MSKISKTIALVLLTVMTVSLVPESVLAKEGVQAEADKAYISKEEEHAETSATEEPKEKPSENTDKEPEETPAETTKEEPEKTPEETRDEEPAEKPAEEPAEKPAEEPSDNNQKTHSRNSTENPADDGNSEEPKQEPETTQPADSIPVVEGTWDETDGKKIFLDNSGKRVTGFCKISDKIYFFDEEGIMKTGWITMTDGTRRYFGADGAGLVDCWKTIGKVKYHFDENGIMATGLKNISGKIYFFDSKGKIKKGWVTTGGKKYYFDKNGVAYTNRWLTKKKKKYHFDSEGVMAKGLTRIGSSLYFFNSKGQMKKGWVTTGGKKYYFDKKGKAYVNRWLTKKKKKYHFDSEGVMAKGLTTIGSSLYFFNSKGQMKKGWVTTGGKKYYFDKKGKAYVSRWLTYKKKKYYFNSEGVMSTGSVVIGGQTYNFDSNGKLKTGWITINGIRYYADKNGKICVNQWITYNKHKYYLGEDGVAVTGMQIIGSHIYYFDSTGMMKTGWITIDGERYYFSSSGAAFVGWHLINNERYYFGEDGKMYHDTFVDGFILGPDGRVINYAYEYDEEEDNDEAWLMNHVIDVGQMTANGVTSSFGEISAHVLGYPDPSYKSGLVVVSGWTYVQYYDWSEKKFHILKAEDFDLNKLKNGDYNTDFVALCNLPGEKITLTVNPSDEFCDFLGWSRKTSDDDKTYDAGRIFSTNKTITVTVAEDEGYYAHCNSPWTGCYFDHTYRNGRVNGCPGYRTFKIHHLRGRRSENGGWTIDTESHRLVARIAYYHPIFFQYGTAAITHGECYGFFMRDENAKYPTEDVYVTILEDEYGRKPNDVSYIHTWIYDLNENGGSDTFALMDANGKIINKIESIGNGYYRHVNPLTGETVDEFYDPERYERLQR